MSAETCSFNARTAQRGVSIPCKNQATGTIQDRRLLPDGKQRPPVPCCTPCALYLLEVSPTNWVWQTKLRGLTA